MCISNFRETFHNYKWFSGFILIVNYNIILKRITSLTSCIIIDYGDYLMLTLC